MSDEIDITIPFADGILAGTLHCPLTVLPRPALIMIHGSGPADRDSGGFFTPIREDLVAAGIAVLSWDKPGIGGSSGDWRRQTFFDRASEAEAALAWLRAQPQVDNARIGVWGHSQGGWIGPLVAARDPQIAALIIHSGTGVTVEEQDYYGMEHTLRQNGASEGDVIQGRHFLTALHAAAKAAMPFAEFQQKVIAPAQGQSCLDYFTPLGAGEWEFFVRNFTHPYDPLWALRHLHCPTLAVFGERDALVPVERSIRILEETLAPVNPALAIEVFPDADHRLKVGDPPAFAPGYFDRTTGWIARTLGAHGPDAG